MFQEDFNGSLPLQLRYFSTHNGDLSNHEDE